MFAYHYDRSERPVQISGPALGTMVYDAHGRRVKQTFNGETIATAVAFYAFIRPTGSNDR